MLLALSFLEKKMGKSILYAKCTCWQLCSMVGAEINEGKWAFSKENHSWVVVFELQWFKDVIRKHSAVPTLLPTKLAYHSLNFSESKKHQCYKHKKYRQKLSVQKKSQVHQFEKKQLRETLRNPKITWTRMTRWWFQPLWKILVKLDRFPW